MTKKVSANLVGAHRAVGFQCRVSFDHALLESRSIGCSIGNMIFTLRPERVIEMTLRAHSAGRTKSELIQCGE